MVPASSRSHYLQARPIIQIRQEQCMSDLRALSQKDQKPRLLMVGSFKPQTWCFLDGPGVRSVDDFARLLQSIFRLYANVQSIFVYLELGPRWLRSQHASARYHPGTSQQLLIHLPLQFITGLGFQTIQSQRLSPSPIPFLP